MAEVQEITDPLNEIKALLEAWAEAHGISAVVIIATREIGEEYDTMNYRKGHPLLVEGLCRNMADQMEDSRRGLCEF